MPVLTSLFFGLVPMLLFAGFINWLDRYEKEPKILLGLVFTWGAIFAAAAFLVNTFFGVSVYALTGSESAADFATGSLFAPIVEETLKGAAVLFVFLAFRSEFDSVLDGMIYAAVTALGFAATENAYYIYSYGYQADGWAGLILMVFIRVILVGWQHPFYTSFFGIGLAVARLNRSKAIKFIAPLLGLATAMTAHAFHNTINPYLVQTIGPAGLLAGTFLDWGAWLLMFGFAIWMVFKERKILSRYLDAEVASGIISSRQYRIAISFFGQGFDTLKALFSGRYRATGRFYQLCGELAHKKNQLALLGEEGGTMTTIEDLRLELHQRSQQITKV